MIFDAIIGLLFSLLSGLVALFPAWSLPAGLTDFGAGLGARLAGVNEVIPVATIGVVLSAIVSAWVFTGAVQLVVFVYRLIPGKLT